jgi:hypothetical protein
MIVFSRLTSSNNSEPASFSFEVKPAHADPAFKACTAPNFGFILVVGRGPPLRLIWRIDIRFVTSYEFISGIFGVL